MFWILVVAPFLVLGLAIWIARGKPLVRFALALGGLFLVLDGLVFWEVMSPPHVSTGSISIGVLGLLELGFAIAVLIASLFARKAAKNVNTSTRHGR